MQKCSVHVFINNLKYIWKYKLLSGFYFILFKEDFEDTKGVIRNRKSKKDRQCTMTNRKTINNDLQKHHTEN